MENCIMEEEKKTIKGYKGFDKELKCRDFQYEAGKEYQCENAVSCVEAQLLTLVMREAKL